MARGWSRDAWDRTSWVLAQQANIHRDPKKHRVFRPSDFNPYETKPQRGMPINARNIHVLKKVFVGAASTSQRTGESP